MPGQKRTYETGSFTCVGENRYRLFVSAGTGLGGKRVRRSKTITAKNDREAQRELKKFQAEIDQMENKERTTVKHLLDQYMQLNVAYKASRTQAWYKDTLRRVYGALGHIELAELKAVDIQRFYAVLADPDAISYCDGLRNGLSAETIRHHHRALCAALNWAYQNEMMDKKLSDRVKQPTSDTLKKRVLYDEEIRRLKEALISRPLLWRTYLTTALVTGLRRQEVSALQWKAIDLEKCTIRVECAITVSEGGKNTLGRTKNLSSMRLLTVPADLISLFKKWKRAQAEERMRCVMPWTGDFVFTTQVGTPVSVQHCSSYAAELFDALGIEEVTLHSLRHTCITRLLASGLPVNDVAAYAGHASAKMTLDVYGKAALDYAVRCAVASGVAFADIF